MKKYKDINNHQNVLAREYHQSAPDMLNSFMAMHKVAMAEGALSVKNKELIALGIGIAARCDGCIGAHVQAALQAGATREELVETVNVAVVMGGGPSITYGTQALGAVDEFLAD
ncbi:carboxymuconolactone decarboxylase family protein [Marinomonas algarum]|uniref:Carboxymuconolactone decarboxylase family protein n=1 Tax=Marinomonas algarum TaxID=2883105 RepID=A0A9X1INS7_9GAMM|nr:carboxymuconolactone decarboxylase family protein [Marinomonas algarum]MCB5162727.1 carboxymuconolactone decarboxylase family protein [Marinomonas algarum]